MGEMTDIIFEIRFPDVKVLKLRNRTESSGSARNEQREKDRAGISFLAQTPPERDRAISSRSRPTKKKRKLSPFSPFYQTPTT
jgi:hypothetical protein